jgi:type I restriction-modification system DNA methylase subunit
LAVERPTEATYVPFLLEELKSRNVKIDLQLSYVLIDGVRQQPDAKFLNGGTYYLEAELGPKNKLYDGLVQAYNYRKALKAKGAFAVVFPDQLRRSLPHDAMRELVYSLDSYVATAIFEDADPRPTLSFDGTLQRLADWISDLVLKPPVAVVPSTDFAVSVLAHAVTYLTAALKDVEASDLEDIFGGRTVFENILQYEEGKFPVDDMRKAAAYLIINQILFYHVLSRSRPEKYDQLDVDTITRPNSLAKYFYRVLDDDYTPVFGFDVVSRLPKRADVTLKLKDVTKRILALTPEKVAHDILGQVFHELIPWELRKKVAAFYTNPEAADMLARLAVTEARENVMDLAVGSGTLLVAAYHRKKELMEAKDGKFTITEHRQFLEEDLTGVDIMPFAAHLAVVHLALQEPLFETEKVRVAVWDSTELTPNKTIPAISRELRAAYKVPKLDHFVQDRPIRIEEEAFIKKGAVTANQVGGEEIPLRKVDLVIMNPPFTRHERVPKEYKQKLEARLHDYSSALHGQLGLYGYFILLADRFIKDEGKIAFVLPSSVLRVQSTQGIRDTWLSKYHIEFIITAWERAAFSEATEFREILVVGTKLPPDDRKNNDLVTAFVTLRKLPKSRDEASKFAEHMRRTVGRGNETSENDQMSVRLVRRSNLVEASTNLFTFIAAYDPRIQDVWEELSSKRPLVSMEDYVKQNHAEVVRGIETKSSKSVPVQSTYILRDKSRAEKKNDIWILSGWSKTSLTARNRFEGSSVKIPLTSVSRALRSPSTVSSFNISELNDFVVAKDFPDADKFFGIKNYAKRKKQLKDWKEYVDSRLSTILLARRFDMSSSGTCLFAFYSNNPLAGAGVNWDLRGLKEEDAKLLTVWYNSTPNILQIFLTRIETRGAWINFHEYALNELRILDTNKLAPDARRSLLKTFSELKDTNFPSLLEQLRSKHPGRRKVDIAVMTVLGYTEAEAGRIIDNLYPALADEIDRLKSLMAGKGGEEEDEDEE